MIYFKGSPLNFTQYPAGELHFRKEDNPQIDSWCNPSTVTVQFEGSDDLVKLALLDDFLVQNNIPYDLLIPYFPSSRQDRVEEFESHSLRVYVNIIKQLNANKIITLDPHSTVLEGMFEAGRLNTIPQEVLLYESTKNSLANKDLVLVSPDKGSTTKTKKCAKYLEQRNFNIKGILQADKVRDYHTGDITETAVDFHTELNGPYTFLVVDDICDGGRTFTELAKKLNKLYSGKKDLILYVTHGLFTKGLEPLSNAGYSEIYTGFNYDTTK